MSNEGNQPMEEMDPDMVVAAGPLTKRGRQGHIERGIKKFDLAAATAELTEEDKAKTYGEDEVGWIFGMKSKNFELTKSEVKLIHDALQHYDHTDDDELEELLSKMSPIW